MMGSGGNFGTAEIALRAEPRRDRWRAMRRGFRLHCPNCGNGFLFRSYLEVNGTCPVCGEEFFHECADDAPPYLTILVVSPIVGGLMLGVDALDSSLPIWLHALVWPTLALSLCLVLLPRFKGAVIALQWALRMHGFGTAPAAIERLGKVL